jgi:hypothetical protein
MKSFIVKPLGTSTTKLFMAVFLLYRSKLVFSNVSHFHPSPIVEGKAGSQPLELALQISDLGGSE